jgi:hypothetical protein
MDFIASFKNSFCVCCIVGSPIVLVDNSRPTEDMLMMVIQHNTYARSIFFFHLFFEIPPGLQPIRDSLVWKHRPLSRRVLDPRFTHTKDILKKVKWGFGPLLAGTYLSYRQELAEQG